MTILTPQLAEQYAMEVKGGGAGVFTSLFVDALSGAAANLVGDVTPGSVYAHIDQSLGPWAQRPVFKTNVKTFVSLRKAAAPIPLADLQAFGNALSPGRLRVPPGSSLRAGAIGRTEEGPQNSTPRSEEDSCVRGSSEIRQGESCAARGCAAYVARCDAEQILRIDRAGPALPQTRS